MANKDKDKDKPAEEFPTPVYEGKPYGIKRYKNAKKASRWKPLRKYVVMLALLGGVLGIVLYIYYQRYSVIIDNGLQGKIFERSSGIYAAPLTLHSGENRRMNDLIRHLQNLGYVQRGASEPGTHGQFAANGNALDVFPSPEAVIDGAKLFQPLHVEFGSGGIGIQSINAIETRQSLTTAQIEPEQISSTINEQREKRKIIKYEDLPYELVLGIVAIEDRGFFQHSGISLRGILRALFRNYEAGEVREGGSTITQQLVKGFFLTPEKTLKRKLSEAYMAIILEQKLSKTQIFEMYCNQIYLGQRGGFSINGFGEAARAYFGKDVRQLLPHESALLAAMIHSPNAYSLRSYSETNPVSQAQINRLLERRNTVLDLMVEASNDVPRSKDDSRPKEFSSGDAAEAKRRQLDLIESGRANASDAPYFVDYVMRQLEAHYGEDTQSMRSMRTYTTVDLDLQRAAYAAVTNRMPEIANLVAARRRITDTHGLQVAMVAMDAKNGDILAMIGGRDYAFSQLNRATDAKRQPGSVFKPFVYAAALNDGNPERRVTAAMTFKDEPRTFEFDGKPYTPGNFGDTYDNRSMTVREALYRSKNVIAVSVAERVGFQQVANLAQSAGLVNVPALPSVALGAAEATPLQMASAYTAFPNRGKRVAPVAIRRITTKEGSTIFDAPTQANDVMSPQVAYLMTSMMQDVLDHGTGMRVRQLGFRGIAAGKTGSSRDGWFAGYTRELVCVVWIGFDDNTDIGVTGGSTAALIWADFMTRALQLRPEMEGAFESPTEGLVTMYIDPLTGQPAQTDTPGARAELFLTGTENGDAQPFQPERSSPPPSYPEYRPSASDSINTTTADVSPPPNARELNDIYTPIPPEARGSVSLFSREPGVTSSTDSRTTQTPTSQTAGNRAPATTGTTASSRAAESKPAPPTQAAAKNSRGATIRVTPGAMPGATPWPAPSQTNSTRGATAPQTNAARGTATKPAPNANAGLNVIVVNGGAGSGRPRVVVTPTPAPKSSAAKTVVPPKAVSPKAPPRTAATKSKTAKPATPKPTPAQLAKATKTAPKPALSPSPQMSPQASPQVRQTPASPTPSPSSQPTTTPAPAKAAAAPGRSFVLEVCSVSKLIPVKGVCKTTERRTFHVGQEPKHQCSADRHGGN